MKNKPTNQIYLRGKKIKSREQKSPECGVGKAAHSSGKLNLLQGIFPTQGLNPGLLHCRWILYQLSTREAQEYWTVKPIPSPADVPNPGDDPWSPALHDSLPTEQSKK